ncbi:MAG: PrsW family intramembrane metalloprotease [Thermoguttaceae bacterium]|nr:PrsW family intramembrane metalloprotease [Thermoguttaceae bacterium]
MWYYIENGQRMGPVPFEEIVNLINQGSIKETTFVWQSGKMRQTAGMSPELLPYLRNANSSSPGNYSSVKQKAAGVSRSIFGKLKESTGVGQMEGFSFSDMFSEMFKKHTDEEMENYFGVGFPATTPPLSQVSASWPKPWFFMRLILFGLIGFYVLWFGFTKWGNHNCAPGAIFFGSFAIPLASVMFFFECNVLRNVSLYQVIKLFLYGGTFGLLFALAGFDFMTFAKELGASRAGPVEEPAKLLVLIVILKMGGLKNKNYILKGLLCGAAVGAGFAAFESAGYAFRIFEQATLKSGIQLAETGIFTGYSFTTVDPTVAMYNNLVMRGLLSPFGHIIWTGMCAAALWRVKGDKEFEFSMLFNPHFLIVFAIAVVLHMVGNSRLFLFWGYYPREFVLGAIGWLVVFGLMGIGLRQVRQGIQ